MRLEKASYKAIKYACLKFHYSKKNPLFNLSYSVFEDNKWCGIIMFGRGSNPRIASQYNLKQGNVLELTRIALNGKQKNTSQVISISLKLLKRDVPLCRIVVSFADGNQGHIGIVYQASNWVFQYELKSADEFVDLKTGKNIHSRMVNKKGEFNYSDFEIGKRKNYNEVKRVKKEFVKYKYIYPLDKSLIPMCIELSKPYPKKKNACIA